MSRNDGDDDAALSPAPDGVTAADDTSPVIRRTLVIATAAIALIALVGLGVLWPRGDAPDLGDRPTTYVDARILSVESSVCDAVEVDAGIGCELFSAIITSGDDREGLAEFAVRETDTNVPELSVGDEVVLLDVPTSPPPYRYVIVDVARATPMWILVGLFCAVVVAFGRWQGVRALLGLVASGMVIVAFVVPAILRNEPAIAVALTAAVVVAVLALYLAHGVNMSTTVALAGTLLSLALTTLLAFVAVTLTHLTGLADDSAQMVRITADALDLRGLLIAGIVVGALGVLDDVTVTQVSTVAALRRARPDLSRREIYGRAISVGRDHVASTVNTLVLAYAGASLPLLVTYQQGLLPTGRFVTSEVVATEIVRMLVGSIGIVAAVPITTVLAAFAVSTDDADHGHSHGHSYGHSHGHDHGDGHSHDPS